MVQSCIIVDTWSKRANPIPNNRSFPGARTKAEPSHARQVCFDVDAREEIKGNLSDIDERSANTNEAVVNAARPRALVCTRGGLIRHDTNITVRKQLSASRLSPTLSKGRTVPSI